MGPEVNQSIVNGILQGYKNYIEERKIKREEMNISTAYAWVKGNHIDDQTAEECRDIGVDFKRAKAGYTWGYLQFNIEQDGKKMFIIKNGKYFNEEDFPSGKGVARQRKKSEKISYLERLARINRNIDFPEEASLFTKEQEEQMVALFGEHTLLEEPLARRLEEEFSQFYIVTYEIDESYAISTIRLFMPNPENNRAYEVEDLSEYIGKSTVHFEDSDFEVLVEDGFDAPDTPVAAEYGIVPEEDLVDKDQHG